VSLYPSFFVSSSLFISGVYFFGMIVCVGSLVLGCKSCS
jgi:hypothetical protein